MPFCAHSNLAVANSSTNIDNIFISEYLPYLSEKCIKVYIYGLYLANNSSLSDNNLENFARNLKLTVEEIKEVFAILENEGLVQTLNLNEYEVRFLPIKNVVSNVAKHSNTKYKTFNKAIQEIISERMITPTEYSNYYDTLEVYKIEQEALLLIAKYATTIKGNAVGHSYIITIAKNWAHQGCRTVAQVNEKLLEQERSLGIVKQILEAFGINRIASIEERQEYLRLKNELNYSDEIVLYVAKNCKIKNFAKLTEKLQTYSALNLNSIKEIENYEKSKKDMLSLSKAVVKNLGLFYESHEMVIETYVSNWLNKGFSENVILQVSQMCFKQNKRTLDQMNEYLETLFKKGILSDSSLAQFSEEVLKRDEQIKKVLKACNLDRAVTNYDRGLYNTWTFSWGFVEDVILLVAANSANSLNAFGYINKILESFKQKNIKTVEQAKQEFVAKPKEKDNVKKVTHNYTSRTYTEEELNSLFANLDDFK